MTLGLVAFNYLDKKKIRIGGLWRNLVLWGKFKGDPQIITNNFFIKIGLIAIGMLFILTSIFCILLNQTILFGNLYITDIIIFFFSVAFSVYTFVDVRKNESPVL
jgi:hypothetical protein